MDYKNFIGILFDNPSLISQEEESNTQENKNEENEEQYLIEVIVYRLRHKLSQRGISNLIAIETGFRNIDTENEQELDYSTFRKACEDFNFELSEDECKELFLAFTKEETTKVNYDEFVRILRGELLEKRKEFVENVFKGIVKENKGWLSLDDLILKYSK